MATTAEELDVLIDAGEVATILGLTHRNSVSTYRSRYPDFPAGRPAPGGGRSRLWTREEILDWHTAFRARQTAASTKPSARLEDLVAATTRLLVAHPGQEISIRQIAAEAGVAHSDLYRYATSKDQLVALAIAGLEESVRTTIPEDYDTLVDNLETALQATRAAAGGLRVLTDRALQGKLEAPTAPLAINGIADAIARNREAKGLTSSVDPRIWRRASRRSAGDSTSSNRGGSARSGSRRSRWTRWQRSSGRCSRPDPPPIAITTDQPGALPAQPVHVDHARCRCVPALGRVHHLQAHDIADEHVRPDPQVRGRHDARDRVAAHRPGIRTEQHPVTGGQDLQGAGRDPQGGQVRRAGSGGTSTRPAESRTPIRDTSTTWTSQDVTLRCGPATTRTAERGSAGRTKSPPVADVQAGDSGSRSPTPTGAGPIGPSRQVDRDPSTDLGWNPPATAR